MKNAIYKVIFFCIITFLVIGCKKTAPPEIVEKSKEVISSLPFSKIDLTNLTAFKTKGSNWKIVGRSISDFTKKHDFQLEKGTGVLVNTGLEEENTHLFSAFDHGDMELDIEFMMPKGSNSGIYFQSRYEIQLLDSWKVEHVSSQDCGSIYQRWDETKPEGEKGYEGHPPTENASKAPGLWQHYHIKFRAPRFDANGTKIENARFEEVVHNGVKIHENVEVTGPTRSASAEFNAELALAPLMIQGDHGPVAFRNIKYKLYGSDSLTTTNVKYKYYEVKTPITQIPNMDSLQVIESGSTEIMDVNKLSKRRNGVALRFTSELNVTKPGDYLFHQYSDDGAKLYIDGALLVDNDGKHDFESKRGLINLSHGVHQLQIDYFNNNWGKGMELQYEGPEQELQTLQGLSPYPVVRKKEPLLVNIKDTPEMIRSFVYYGDEKRTHAISVGSPKGVHFSYDLKSGALLKAWKGGFADVTEMWRGRGIDQVLEPQQMSLELSENIIATELDSKKAPYPKTSASESIPKGYEINDAGYPIFKFNIGGTVVMDCYSPSEKGAQLHRTLKVKGKKTLYSRAGVGDYIQKVNQDYYLINGSYYLKNEGERKPFIREIEGKQELIYTLKEESKIEYSIVW
ncbi:MAG: family 16 glycoside hydrolase [Flavobacteriaceae bacterium]